MSKSTRSRLTLPGGIREYLEGNKMPDTTPSGTGSSEASNVEDIQSLLSMMAKTLAAVSQPRTETANQNYKIENCPIKRSSSSLDAWVDEVLLWDESNAALSDSIRAKKYLKLVDSVRKSENCKDIQNLVEVEFVENHEFDKKGVDVIKTIVNKIKEKLGKSDIEKCSSAWIDFINIKQGTDEAASAFVSRFEKQQRW